VLTDEIDVLAQANDFSGVVRIDRGGEVEFAQAYGLANRTYEIANTLDTQFALASGGKGFTALAAVSLIEDGAFDLSTTARSVLGDDLPLIRDDVTVEHLLSHRSGIGDYLDEEGDLDVEEYLMPVPVHELAATEQYVRILDGFETKFPPGERFSYSNSGYVVLALIAERTSGVPFHELVQKRVCEPASLLDTTFLRSDELPGRAAIGYLDGVSRTNVFHLPVVGSGDGGIYSTAGDINGLWRAFFDGRIVAREWVAEMTRARGEKRRYGLGFWLDESGEAVFLTGSDAGVSFHSVRDHARDRTWTVISNTSKGAWPIARFLVAQR
jgi:CubicO group peptidase (beta-lactamase class C family)